MSTTRVSHRIESLHPVVFFVTRSKVYWTHALLIYLSLFCCFANDCIALAIVEESYRQRRLVSFTIVRVALKDHRRVLKSFTDAQWTLFCQERSLTLIMEICGDDGKSQVKKEQKEREFLIPGRTMGLADKGKEAASKSYRLCNWYISGDSTTLVTEIRKLRMGAHLLPG